MARKEYGGTSSFGKNWNPSVDADGNRREKADPKKDYIEGFYLSHEEKTFANNNNPSQIYAFEIAPAPGTDYTGFGNEGEKVQLFGCTILDGKMADFEKAEGFGAWVRVEYGGMELKKAAKAIRDNLIKTKGECKKVFESKDYVKLFKVIADDEIPAIKVEGQTYKAVESNTVPEKKVATAESPALPASLDEPNLDVEEKNDAAIQPANKEQPVATSESSDDDLDF